MFCILSVCFLRNDKSLIMFTYKLEQVFILKPKFRLN